jgi:hypothetical protein
MLACLDYIEFVALDAIYNFVAIKIDLKLFGVLKYCFNFLDYEIKIFKQPYSSQYNLQLCS